MGFPTAYPPVIGGHGAVLVQDRTVLKTAGDTNPPPPPLLSSTLLAPRVLTGPGDRGTRPARQVGTDTEKDSGLEIPFPGFH